MSPSVKIRCREKMNIFGMYDPYTALSFQKLKLALSLLDFGVWRYLHISFLTYRFLK